MTRLSALVGTCPTLLCWVSRACIEERRYRSLRTGSLIPCPTDSTADSNSLRATAPAVRPLGAGRERSVCRFVLLAAMGSIAFSDQAFRANYRLALWLEQALLLGFARFFGVNSGRGKSSVASGRRRYGNSNVHDGI